MVPSNFCKANLIISFDWISKWFVGSSIINVLKGRSNNLQSANLFLSPPESTFVFLVTSSPEKRKLPSKSRTLVLVSSVAASSASCKTVFSGLRTSSWFCAKYPMFTLCPRFHSPE